MKLSTFKEIVKNYYPKVVKEIEAIKSIDKVPFYGELYNNTYNQQDPYEYIDIYIETIKKLKLKNVLETFSGNAFESFEVSKKLPKVKFSAIDIDINYFEKKFPKITYIKGNCYEQKKVSNEPYDLIFTGATNASNCVIPNVKEWLNYFSFCYKNLSDNGYLAVSTFFDPGCANSDYFLYVDSQETKIYYGPNKGNTLKWITVSVVNTLGGFHDYYDLVLFYKNPTDEKPYKAIYCEKGKRFYSIPLSTVIGLANHKKFEYVEDYSKERFYLFKKSS